MTKQYRVNAKPFPNELQAGLAGAAYVANHPGTSFCIRKYRDEGFFCRINLGDTGTLSHGWLSNEESSL